MSWLYSRALVEAYSADICSDGAQSAPSSGNHTPQAYLSQDKMKAFSRLSRSGMTFAPLTENLGEELLMWYLEGFRVKTSPVRVKEQESKVNEVVCGSKCSESQKKLGQSTSSLKTATCYALEDLSPSCKTLPKSGTMQNGLLWEHLTSEPITSENECGYSQEMFPTPQSSDWKNKNHSRDYTLGNIKFL